MENAEHHPITIPAGTFKQGNSLLFEGSIYLPYPAESKTLDWQRMVKLGLEQALARPARPIAPLIWHKIHTNPKWGLPEQPPYQAISLE